MGTERTSSKGPEETSDQASETSTPVSGSGFWRTLGRNWLLIVVVMFTIAIQATTFAYHRLHERTEPPRISPEVPLGAFRFEADKVEGGRTTRADFSLAIALPETMEQAARDRLFTHKFRVQQDVEELLRKAHSGDFDDPTLQELKRQLLEQVNQTLGMRVASDIILTDLKLQREPAPKAPVTDTAKSVPWREKPAPKREPSSEPSTASQAATQRVSPEM